MTAIAIEGAGYPIGKVLSDDFVFNIPNYQRPYAWTTEETEQLLNDLIDALEEDVTPIDKISPYFLGNIVLIKQKGEAESEVVDGQQRLTTLTILFSVLRQLLPKHKKTLESLICQPENILTGIPARPRLILRQRDRDFFQKYIQNLGGIKKQKKILTNNLSDSQRNILENARLLCCEIDKRLPEESQKLRLTQFILQRCYLVIVHTPDFDSAYRIFSVLNDRGLDLSITDILKADIIGKISKDREDQYTQKWEDLEELLGRQDFTDLFSHIRMIYAKSNLQTTVLNSFRIEVLSKTENQNPCYLVDEVIKPYSEAFAEIKHCSYNNEGNNQEINQLFGWLQKIGHSDWIPPALLYLKKYRYQSHELLRFLVALERLAAGLMILKANFNQRIKRYIKILQEIDNNNNLFIQDSFLQLSQEEKKEITNCLNGDIYDNYKAKNARRYIILRLNSLISDAPPNYDLHKRITIEHVLPQNPAPNSEWLNFFPDALERKQYTHKLGNLVLLSRIKNSKASNFEFQKKKDRYFNNPVTTFALTVDVLQEQKWTPEIIDRRQEYLLDKLKEVWQLT